MESGNETHPSGKKSGGSVSASSSNTWRKWGHEGMHF